MERLTPYALAPLNDGNQPDRRQGTLEEKARKAGRRPLKERTRRPEDAPPYAVGHPVKLEALIALHDGPSSAGEVAERIGVDVKNVTNHLHGLDDAGCIEFAGYKVEGNHRKRVYRAVARPYVSDEEYRAMSTEQRHDANGVVVQWILAECLSSYRNEKMDRDDDLSLISDEPNLDAEGRRELREFLTAVWSGESPEVIEELGSVQEIACRAAHRMAKTGETGTTVVVALLAFERGPAQRSKADQPRLSQ
jgi:DNA-binding transcriptional ArsR family regulator